MSAIPTFPAVNGVQGKGGYNMHKLGINLVEGNDLAERHMFLQVILHDIEGC